MSAAELPDTAVKSPPDWREFARTGEWRRALAAARLSGQAEVAAMLEAVCGVQEHVRARRLGLARRALGGLKTRLEDSDSPGEAARLRGLVDVEGLEAALGALEAQRQGREAETDPAALAAQLAPALTHPLTRSEGLNALGVLHALRGEGAEAREQFGAALAHDAGHYRAGTNLGNLDLEEGRLAEAEARYREVIGTQPDYDGAHHNLGVALRRQGRLAESVASIRRAQRLSLKGSQRESREEARAGLGRLGGGAAGAGGLRWGLLGGGALLLFGLLRGFGG
ncbi:tetratricopeptide (TPR) repeat protein [Deinococcus sp. HSC-46F16]|uniref:tetratricopeptide repeat protein n=1 Tax=Deinococcus sp. HSC-46F16 TaxID=2910968 RepID=UPI0020A1822B|nr:tetratricopeptide repeat protein [Deinococcus sp. HSC-46F16]MCP2013558.1 tetratricopeptide (TPR) repeat protein [Deinococcus sp. HSC-46F16]